MRVCTVPFPTRFTRNIGAVISGYRRFSFANRYVGDADAKLLQYVSKPVIAKPEPAWTRLAKKVKGVEEITKDSADSKHIGDIKKNIDLQDTIGKIEDELREEMAKSLGRTGLKMQFSMQQMNEAKFLLDKILCDASSTHEDKINAVEVFNKSREFAYKTRIELIIHRQSIGLTWNNESIVETEFPIPDYVDYK